MNTRISPKIWINRSSDCGECSKDILLAKEEKLTSTIIFGGGI